MHVYKPGAATVAHAATTSGLFRASAAEFAGATGAASAGTTGAASAGATGAALAGATGCIREP